MQHSIDNFDQICNFLKDRFLDEGIFYFMQIIRRKKDNPDAEKSVRIVKSYYVHSIEYLQKKKDEIVELCNKHNARAYINLNPRSERKVALKMLKELADAIANEQYNHIPRLYDSCCGQTSSAKEKLWIVDVDRPYKDGILGMVELINSIKPDNPEKQKLMLSTKSGIHLITTPFDLKAFAKKYPEIDVHKDSPTILYVPIKEEEND